jgi:hypothetical protein
VVKVVLTSIDGFHSRRRPSRQEALTDLAALHGELSASSFSRTDGLRLLLSYLGLSDLTATAKRWLRCRTSLAVLRRIVAFPSPNNFRLRTAEQGAVP